MESVKLPDAFEPTDWYVVFHPTASRRWLGWLAMGRFKHVSAFAYIPGFKAWLVYDVALSGTRLLLLPNDERGRAELVRYTAGCAMLIVKRQCRGNVPTLSALFCTTAICHLLGLTCVARPDALWRLCLRNGGVPLGRQHQRNPDEHHADCGAATAGRPEPAD